MGKYLITLFALLLLVSVVAALVPSESALVAASPYSRSGEEATVVNRPYVIDGKSYWVVYFHPQTSPEAKNAIIAVDAESGELVTDETLLRKIYTFDFKLTFLQDFVAKQRLAFSDLRTNLDAGKTKRDQAEVTLDDLQQSLEREGKNIVTVQNAFSIFIVSAQRTDDSIENGLAAEEVFDREYSSAGLEALIGAYNIGYSSLLGFLRAGNDYQRSVINKSNELTQQGVDPAKFRSQLQSAYDVGLDKFPQLASFQTVQTEFSSINSTQNQRLVNDSIQSYLYRKDKTDADAAVESVRSQVEEVLGRKAEIADCTGTTQLERSWNNALVSQRSNSFAAVQGNVTLVNTELERIRREVEACNPPTQQTPAQKDNTNLYIAGVIALLLAYFGWQYYKKKKAQAEEETENSGKGSLFSK